MPEPKHFVEIWPAPILSATLNFFKKEKVSNILQVGSHRNLCGFWEFRAILASVTPFLFNRKGRKKIRLMIPYRTSSNVFLLASNTGPQIALLFWVVNVTEQHCLLLRKGCVYMPLLAPSLCKAEAHRDLIFCDRQHCSFGPRPEKALLLLTHLRAFSRAHCRKCWNAQTCLLCLTDSTCLRFAAQKYNSSCYQVFVVPLSTLFRPVILPSRITWRCLPFLSLFLKQKIMKWQLPHSVLFVYVCTVPFAVRILWSIETAHITHFLEGSKYQCFSS